MERGRLSAAVLASVLAACGGASRGATTAGPVSVEPADFLQEVGGRSSPVLRPPERSIDELEAARAEATGTDRRRAVRDLVVAHLFAAEGAEPRDARRHRRTAERLADAGLRGSRDSAINAELDFAKLWLSWRADSAAAPRRAERFTDRYPDSGELVALAWMIRGEIALASERFDDAIAAYRFALGRLESPLYGYALFRTARSHRGAGRAEDADQALREVESLGCRREVEPLTARLAAAAASERGVGTRSDPDGTTRPASCPAPSSEGGEGASEDWRPQE